MLSVSFYMFLWLQRHPINVCFGNYCVGKIWMKRPHINHAIQDIGCILVFPIFHYSLLSNLIFYLSEIFIQLFLYLMLFSTSKQVRNFLVLPGAQPMLPQKCYQVITRKRLTSGVLVSSSIPYWSALFHSKVIHWKLSSKPLKPLNLIFIAACGSLYPYWHEISLVGCLPVMSPQG